MCIRIAIGSKNPVKFAAAEAVLQRAFPNADFILIDVPSGIADQPWGDEETRQGAFNRATAALSQGKADFGVGLEGGIIETSVGLMTCAWCAIVDSAGTVGYGGGANILLPPIVAEALRKYGELGPAMDAIVDEHNTKQGRGRHWYLDQRIIQSAGSL